MEILSLKTCLIFEDQPNSFVARVADFGFSTMFRSSHDFISIPARSTPWYAPEHHRREFSPSNAKLMDIYSFGMLCLWLLFWSEGTATALRHQETPPDNGEFMGFDDSLQDLNLLEKLKTGVDYKLLQWAISLVMEHKCVDNNIHDDLVQFFNLTLASKPADRSTDFEQLLNLLAPAR
jgi:serine/threonine protein kinase